MSPAHDGPLVVLSWGGGWGRALAAAVSGPFQRQTGVRVEHRTHVGLALPEDLQASLARGERSPVDVVWSTAAPALRAARDGLCVSLDPAELPVLTQLRHRARPFGMAAGDAIPVVHPYVVYYVLAFHEDAFPDGPPTSWRVLLDPRHRGKIALYPGGHGFYPIAQVMGGGRVEEIPENMEACWAYLRELRPQVGVLDYSVGMEDRLRERRLELCFRALTNALAFRAAGIPVWWTIPREGTADTVDALWVPRNVPESARASALRYIAFALQPEIQEDWCSLLGSMPVHPAARVPALIRGRSDLPSHADDHRGILRVAQEVSLEHELEWETRFREILG